MAEAAGSGVMEGMTHARETAPAPLRIAAAGLAALLLLSGCTFFRLVRAAKLEKPDIAYVGCEVKSISERSALLEFTLSAGNPNAIGLRNVFVDYDLSFEGHRFMRGSTAELVLVPRGETTLKVSAEVDYAEVARAAGPAALQVMAGRESLPVRVDGVVRGEPTVYNEVEEGSLFHFTWKFGFTQPVPIPEEQKALVRKKAARALKKLF